MLNRSRTHRLTALSATLVAGLVTLPLVVAFAVEQEPTSKPAPRGQQPAAAPPAILRGRVTGEAGEPLADVRVRVAIPADDMRFVDVSTPHRQLEAVSDAHGDYRLELPGITERTKISIDAMKPGHRRLVGTLMSGGDAKSVVVAPGAAVEASLKLKPALYFAGIVVDEQGRPIPGVKISANSNSSTGSGGIERTATHLDGSFELFNYSTEPRGFRNEVSKGVVLFFHPDYLDARIDDVYAIAQDQREALPIVLGTGHKVMGTVFDVAGKPVPHAMIKVVNVGGGHRKATLTDANGKFALRGLGAGPSRLTARAFEIKQKLLLPMAVDGDRDDLEVRLQAMALPADLKTYAVLGMQLADVSRELMSAYDLFLEAGAVILDPGKDPDRLKIGRLAEGYSFFMVGNTRIFGVREFVSQVLAEAANQAASPYSVRVVYSLSTLAFDGTNTQYLKLTKDDLEPLQKVLDQLKDVAP